MLSDPAKRARFDQLGANWQQYEAQGTPYDEWFRQAAGRGAGAGQPGGGGWRVFTFGGGQPGGAQDAGDMGGFSDFFRAFFGDLGGSPGGSFGGGRFADFAPGTTYATTSATGQDLEHEFEVTLEEAAMGGSRAIELTVPDDAGARRIRRLDVKIPAGVRDGSKLRIAGEGGRAGPKGQPGDLYLVVRLRPHPIFEVRGDDLWAEAPVGLYDAVLGGKIVVPTITGRADMTIPPETQNGQIFRLKGQGLPSLRGGAAGDGMVKVKVELPRNLTAEEIELFRQLAAKRDRRAN